MSLSNYEQARELINQNSRESDFEGEKAESLVSMAEHRLGLIFPPSYRQFLSDFGCGSLWGVEICGIVNGNFEASSVPDGVWLTIDERKRCELPHQYVLIGDLGDGSYYAIDTNATSAGGESPVLLISADFKTKEVVYDSFGTYLLSMLQEAIQ